MIRVIRFAIALVLGLGFVTWLAAVGVLRTTRQWFERDLTLRAEVAVRGATPTLVAEWETPVLGEVLADLTRDERILSAAGCSRDLHLLAATDHFPLRFGCEQIGSRVRELRPDGSVAWMRRATSADLPDGEVHVTAVPVLEAGRVRGFVILVHDLSYALRREDRAKSFLLGAFAFLASAAALVTLAIDRFAWRGWSMELREVLQKGKARPEFRPILQDVRELAERLASERDTGGGDSGWSPARLRATLSQSLRGQKVIMVANREPYMHVKRDDGTVTVLHPASGLVTALEPVMRACSGTWIAHGGGSADRETADAEGRLGVPPGDPLYTLRRVWLSAEEERGYYYGFSNEGLWPLCHLAHARPTFRTADWELYRKVNERFADVVAAEADSDSPIVLVQDYHFALLPALVRKRIPAATVITFWHIPWPNAEQFGICPFREEILEGLLGSSILGFHTRFHGNNFLEAADRYLEARIDREENAVVRAGRSTSVRAYPISVEWPVRWILDIPPVAECRASVREELGLPEGTLLGVGVDRLDYTKGIEERFLAVEALLENHPELRGRFTFVQLAAPSRTFIDRYQHLNQDVEALAARINERFGGGAAPPIRLLLEHHEPPRVFRFLRAADLCYVSSLHDGMNLVAKEFVAARDDDAGVLVLSQFTGAARELTEALIVNPYDFQEASAALAAALRMPKEEQAERMRAMRSFVGEFNVYRWAGRMILDASRRRDRDQLSGRLATTGTKG